MTKHLSETLGLPLLEDALREAGQLPPPADDDDDAITTDEEHVDLRVAHAAAAASQRMAEAGGEDHARAMDQLHRETLDKGRELFDLAMNMDYSKGARGMFEQAANFYKLALDSKDTKRQRQLDAMNIALNQRKLELLEQQKKGEPDDPGSNPIVVEDRNELIKRLRAQMKAK